MVHDRIISMDDLPKTNPVPSHQPKADRPFGEASQPAGGGGQVGSISEEVAPVTGNAEVGVFSEIGREVELSPEVKKAGVTIKSDTIVLPPSLTELGMREVTPPPAAASKVVLPLSDEQIAQGLQQSLLSSWRWLAEWCRRQLLQAHVILKTVKGSSVRSKG